MVKCEGKKISQVMINTDKDEIDKRKPDVCKCICSLDGIRYKGGVLVRIKQLLG